MRNTKIALAVLALVASTAAMANGASIGGTLDAGIANTTGSNNTTRGTNFSGSGGWVAGNNINFKGSEDIDGGIKANYLLQAGINLGSGLTDNGGNNNGLFTQIAQVGVSSTSVGTLTLGQQLSPYIGAQAAGTAGNGHFFVNRIIMGGGFGNAAVGATVDATSGFFISNAVSYTTPSSIEGISATVLKGFRNSTQGGGATVGGPENSYTAASVTGTFGDVKVAVGMQDRVNTIKGYTASAAYTMGQVTLAGNYTTSNTEGAATAAVNSYSGSVSYKLIDPLTLSLQYARNNLATAQTLSNVGAQYSLSKNTSLYATYGRGTNGAQSNYDYRGSYSTTTTASSTTVAAGVVHSF
jgi:predicted porin